MRKELLKKLVIKLPMRWINHIAFLLITIICVGCGPAIGHEIINVEESLIIVNLESKVDAAELKEFARYYFDEYQHDNFLQVQFRVPSEYTEYPDDPWARVFIDKRVQEEIVQIFGTKNVDDELRLKNITLKNPGIKGKWYFKHPFLESIYFLIENEEDTLMLIYEAHDYYEMNGVVDTLLMKDQKQLPGQDPIPETVYDLIPGSGINEYYNPPICTPYYRINGKGELILLLKQKSDKDTSPCVLQPIPM